MEKINNEQFGQFLSQLRKEKELTQKQLAEKLYISDKAVSKWERGLSLPDISLLMPLAKILGVTTTELLRGERIASHGQIALEEVEALMAKTIDLSKEEGACRGRAKQIRQIIFFTCMVIFALELFLFRALGYTLESFGQNLGTVELLMLIFGIYFTFFAKEVLPVYYDENRISFYSDGVFHMNMTGIQFNNSNWSYILRAIQGTVMGVLILFPLLFLAISEAAPLVWEKGRLPFTLAAVFSIFIAIYSAGKKHQ